MAIFKGFNTVDQNFPPFGLVDAVLIKRDLLNEFNTRMGERVMRPEFGTIIFDMLMEPADDITYQNIEEDAIRIVRKDKRLTLTSISVTNSEKTVVVSMQIQYTPNGLKDSLAVEYQKSTETTVT